jgi:REP element-mobilizing transposase RayT
MGSTLTNLLYHVVFSTKNRERLITQEIRNDLYRYMGGIITGENGILIEIGGSPDHIHIFLKLKPIHSLSEMMRKIKGNSSKWVNDQKRLVGRFSWQDGYGAFSVSESQAPNVTRYIKNQEHHHQTLSFKDELIKLLKRNRIEYDEHNLWN